MSKYQLLRIVPFIFIREAVRPSWGRGCQIICQRWQTQYVVFNIGGVNVCFFFRLDVLFANKLYKGNLYEQVHVLMLIIFHNCPTKKYNYRIRKLRNSETSFGSQGGAVRGHQIMPVVFDGACAGS